MRLEVTIDDPAGFEEVEVVAVLVAAGDAVAEGDVLLEVATDKANLDIAAPAAGTVAEVLVSRDEIIATDAVLIVLET
jgi:pyruvate/2-oxoglutarate dehydrogenase complex dihydrolipoamide acyltransferase (E2) component